MRFLWRSIAGLFLTAVTFGLVIYAVDMVRGSIEARMADERPSPPPREREFTVNVVTAVPGVHTPVLQAFGEVRAQRSLELRAAASGRVIEVAPSFSEGGAVRGGDILVRIDPTEAEAERDRLAADLTDAEAEVRDAKAALGLANDDKAGAEDQERLRDQALQRQRDLQERGVGTESAVETAALAAAAARQSVLTKRQAITQAEARISQSNTQLIRAQIALAEAQRRVEDTVLTAPFDGTLSEVSLAQGRLVTNNEQLATLVDPDALEVSFRLSTVQYARLLGEAGQLESLPVEAQLDVSGIDLKANGMIQRDSAAVGEAQSGRVIFAALDAAPGFKPGDFVTVSVQETTIDRAILLPASALDGSGTVLVLGPENRLETVDVTLLRRQGNEVLVGGRDVAGREVVTSRTPLLGTGIRVKPLRTTDAAAPEEPALVELTDERRAKLIAFVEANNRMPAEVKTRILGTLVEAKVPEQLVSRLESRMGG